MASKIITAVTAAALLVVVGGLFTAERASADETGLASIHSWSRQGHRICFTDHFHSGTGTAKPTKAAALEDAAHSWAEFTAAEYGTSWAYFGKAASKSEKCDKVAGGFACSVEARPCK
jgi:hypothetical protein